MANLPGRPEGPSGRRYERMNFAIATVIEELKGEKSNFVDGIMNSFRDVVWAFGADKAVVLVPIVPTPEGEDAVKYRIISSHGLREEHRQAITRGQSVNGVSASNISRAYATQATILIPHPRLMTAEQATTAIKGDYSVMVAPVTNEFGTEVVAIYYLQTHGLIGMSSSELGINHMKAFSESDRLILDSFVRVLRFVLEKERTQAADYLTSTYDEHMKAHATAFLKSRIAYHGHHLANAAKSLGMNRTRFYDLLKRHGIPAKREALAAQEQQLEEAEQAAGVGEDPDTNNDDEY